MTKRLLYWDWIQQEAALIHADGCTGVTNLYPECCLQHDLEFYYGKDAVSAYHERHTAMAPWVAARSVTLEQANDHFKRCLFRSSRAGYWNPIAWVRYTAVRMKKGRAAWDAHRRRERETAA